MNRCDLFFKLWEMYLAQNPMVQKVHESFKALNENVVNDHIAFRTFNDKRINIEALEKHFINVGYVEKGSYYFEEKKLLAKHYEIPNEPNEPRVFISELILGEFSKHLQNIISSTLNSVSNDTYLSDNLIFSGNIWETPSYDTYHALRDESEYAAWLYVFGFRVNHFTVSINNLNKLNSINKVNAFLKSKGFVLNASGGEIKGSKSDLLQQSSIMAEDVPIKFKEGIYKIPGCYYEFAIRYKNKEGNLFSGFLAKNADKIFESTNYH